MSPKNGKTAPDIFELTKKYGLTFEGPAPPNQWPSRYKETFEVVWNMKDLKFDDLKKTLTNDSASDSKQVTQRRIVDALRLSMWANECRELWSNEETWKLNLTTKVFRIAACGSRCWASSFQALREDENLRNQLNIRQMEIKACTCNEEHRASAFIRQHEENNMYPENIFQMVYNTEFIYDSSDDIEISQHCAQRPDGVYGFRKMGVFDTLLKRHEGGLWASPFGDEAVLYPFLVVGWKPEQGGLGFSSIERQTAFPIRTMLRLQQDLYARGTPRAGMDPLVWFIANQGEDWRVYACITDGGRFRVFHLWKGMVTLPEDAAQLLYIIDYIADWAREVYLWNVFRCLLDVSSFGATGDDSMRSRTSSLFSYASTTSNNATADEDNGESKDHGEDTAQQGTSFDESVDCRTTSATLPRPQFVFGASAPKNGLFGSKIQQKDQNKPAPVQDSGTKDLFHKLDLWTASFAKQGGTRWEDLAGQIPSITSVFTKVWAEEDQRKSLREIISQSGQKPRTMLRFPSERYAISHLNLELDRFRHVHIPEEDTALDFFITKCEGPITTWNKERDKAEAAAHLLNMFTHGQIYDVESLNELERLWTNSTTSIELDRTSRPVSCICYHSFLDKSSCVIVRDIVCLTASEITVKKISAIAGLPFLSYRTHLLPPKTIVRDLRNVTRTNLFDQLIDSLAPYILTIFGTWTLMSYNETINAILPTEMVPVNASFRPPSSASGNLVKYDMRPSEPPLLSNTLVERQTLQNHGLIQPALLISNKDITGILVIGPHSVDDNQSVSEIIHKLKSTKFLFEKHRSLTMRPMEPPDRAILDSIEQLLTVVVSE